MVIVMTIKPTSCFNRRKDSAEGLLDTVLQDTTNTQIKCMYHINKAGRHSYRGGL